jgi:hypothetical protein
VILGPLPALGVGLLGAGVGFLDRGGPVSQGLIALAAAAGLLGFVIAIIQPTWWGPGWLRALRAAGVDIHGGLDRNPIGEADQRPSGVVFLSGSASPSVDTDNLIRQFMTGAEPMEQWTATEVRGPDGSGPLGQLWRYETGLFFVTDQPISMGDDRPARFGMPMPFSEVKGLELIHRVQAAPNGSSEPTAVDHAAPLVFIRMGEAGGWMFKLTFPSAVARRIAEFARCPVQELP